MRSSPQTKTLAVLVRGAEGAPPFSDELFCRRLSLESHHFDLNIIVLPISSDRDDPLPQKGYIYRNGLWKTAPIHGVQMLMDRCLLPLPKKWRQQLQKLTISSSVHVRPYWSASLPGKWKVHRVLSREPQLRKLLIPTVLLQPGAPWEKWLERWPKGLFFKPVSGTHGKETFRLTHENAKSSWTMEGRDKNNERFYRTFYTRHTLSAWLESQIADRQWIMQPYLDLSHDRHPFDIRALVQKNGHGQWTLTGCMVREGAEGSLTSNLHGGGKAHPARPYLLNRYGDIRTDILLESISRAAALIPPLLESQFGRLAELGLDFGVDSKGRLWLLEVNSKPGRSSFAEAGDRQMQTLTYTKPLAYARYLLQQHVLSDVVRPMKMPNTSSTAGLKPIPIHGG
ncbi:YheC/YheD family protein [Paenibacillus xylanilyticus]|uniref:YheC/YheD family endospore coat-associated protein n=1 Tax=Paenibacillus xylanilyticus TaxID=248903 RepID=UPI0039A07284